MQSVTGTPSEPLYELISAPAPLYTIVLSLLTNTRKMLMTEPTKPWNVRDFEYYWSSMLRKLETVYIHVYPNEKSFPGVYANIFLQNPDPDEYARHFFASSLVSTVDVVLVSAIYSARALREYHNNQKQLAWAFLMDAQYYAGAAWYAMAFNVAMPGIEEGAALSAIKDMQREGGKVKNAPWLDIENHAVKLIQALASEGKTWRTERKMAAAIKKELILFAEANGVKISEKRFVQTVSDRLKQRQEEIGPYLTRRKEKPC